VVPPLIKRKLRLQGRFYELRPSELVEKMIADLPRSGKRETKDNSQRIERIADSIRERLPDMLHTEFPAHEFSRRLLPELFERMGLSTVRVQEGAHERGSDLVVTVGHPLLFRESTVGVQAFSWEGKAGETSVREKLTQLLSGWKENDLDSGVLLTTGTCDHKVTQLVGAHNREHPDQPVKLIDGPVLAELFLAHYGDAIAGRGASSD
jgi:hypothetical protein